MLDAPWVEDGKFTRIVAPADEHPLAAPDRGRPAAVAAGARRPGARSGTARPYAVDTIEPPFENPWNALLFFGDHDFLPDGTAMLCTMQGDVWRVDGLDDDARARPLAAVRLGPAPGARPGRRRRHGPRPRPRPDHPPARPQRRRRGRLLRVRQQRLRDLARRPRLHLRPPARRARATSTRPRASRGCSGSRADGKTVEVLATGFRNPDGLGLAPDGVDHRPELRRGLDPRLDGLRGPARRPLRLRRPEGRPAARPAAGLPARAGWTTPAAARSYVPERPLGAARRARCSTSRSARGRISCCSASRSTASRRGPSCRCPASSCSGVHRGRFNPKDGQLYVSGMAGWGTYTPHDGCFQRVRYTGDPVQLPVAFHAHENGVLVTLHPARSTATVAEQPGSHFAQAWNYRYSAGYGSPELSPRHPGMPGHDPLPIRSAHVLADGRTLFLEIPDLQPVNQLHLHLRVDDGAAARPLRHGPQAGRAVHRVPRLPARRRRRSPPTRSSPTWPRSTPSRCRTPGASRSRAPATVTIEAGKNLTFSPAVVHGPGRRADQADVHQPRRRPAQLGPDPAGHAAAGRRPGQQDHRRARRRRPPLHPPDRRRARLHRHRRAPGRSSPSTSAPRPRRAAIRYLCTFPGHWMVMNGVMTVE